MNALNSALAHLLQAHGKNVLDRLELTCAEAEKDSSETRDSAWLQKARAASLASATVLQAAAQEYNALIDERYLHAAK